MMEQFNSLIKEQGNHKRSITLLELLIAISLLSVIVLALSSIDLFSRRHVISSDRRAKIQNEVSYVLEHISKEMARAIGNERIDGADSVVRTDDDGSRMLMCIYIDASGNGQREAPQDDPAPNMDHYIAYRYELVPCHWVLFRN